MEEETLTETQEAPLQAQPVIPEAVRDALFLANARFRAVAERRVDIAYRAFRRGSAAAFGKLSRTSTEYENAEADQFFFAGYDGDSWEDAVKRIIV